MFPTMEVRWFYQGVIPPKVATWFQQAAHPPVEEPRRVDYYLRLEEERALGIKLREGRVEIKQRFHEGGVVRFQEQAAGVMEGWGKWSFPLAETEGWPASGVGASPAWIGVQKERKLRRVRLTGDREMVAIPPAEWPERGCDFELVRIRVRGQEWWSVCFESFGDPSSLLENLLLTAKRILGDGTPLPLEAESSYAYPHWLGLLAG
jgi:hypothetical protein